MVEGFGEFVVAVPAAFAELFDESVDDIGQISARELEDSGSASPICCNASVGSVELAARASGAQS